MISHLRINLKTVSVDPDYCGFSFISFFTDYTSIQFCYMAVLIIRLGIFTVNITYCLVQCDVQIELMLKMGVKAEIQCLYTISHNFLTNIYLPNKLQNSGWI